MYLAVATRCDTKMNVCSQLAIALYDKSTSSLMSLYLTVHRPDFHLCKT